MSEPYSGICYKFVRRESLGAKKIALYPHGLKAIFLDKYQPENSKYFGKWCCRASDNHSTWLRVTRRLIQEDPFEWLPS